MATFDSHRDPAPEAQPQPRRLQTPPPKLAPATVEAYSLVVLRCESTQRRRKVQGLQRVLQTSDVDARWHLLQAPPYVLKRHMTLSEAQAAQNELICCEIISVFLDDSVVTYGDPQYLAKLFRVLLLSEEFELLTLTINSLPENDAGKQFSEQYVGRRSTSFPFTMTIMRKKARLMCQSAESLGIDVSLHS